MWSSAATMKGNYWPTPVVQLSSPQRLRVSAERLLCPRTRTYTGHPSGWPFVFGMTPPGLSPGDAGRFLSSRHVMHQGIPIPRPQCHNAMISMGSGGPARTRTWDCGYVGLLGHLSRITLSRTPTGIRRAPSPFSLSVAHKNLTQHFYFILNHITQINNLKK